MTADDAKQALQHGVDAYLQSISGETLDLTIAESVWLTAPEASFIHPRGHEHGWDQIVANFYKGTMADQLSNRHLSLANEPTMNVFGDAAVVEFNWDFRAVFRHDGHPLHTTGRESQVWTRTSEGWRLVHVHYSGPPKTGVREGF